MDFKKATELFADPDFDGDPVVIYEPKDDESPVPPDEQPIDDVIDDGFVSDGTIIDDFGDGVKPKKYFVNNVAVSVVAERVQYFDANGKLITESLKDYTRKTLYSEYATMDDFLTHWNNAEKKQAIIEELADEGIFFDALEKEIGKKMDPFDIICHIAWDMPPLSRRERAENVKKQNYFAKYSEKAQKVLDALLDKYADEGIQHIEETQILTINPFTEIGTPMEIINNFGGIEKYKNAVLELEHALYSA
jgi:type I restriction enzyme R subunit